jgi:hypothetical protein
MYEGREVIVGGWGERKGRKIRGRKEGREGQENPRE